MNRILSILIVILINPNQLSYSSDSDNHTHFFYAPTRAKQVTTTQAPTAPQKASCKLCQAIEQINDPIEFPIARTNNFIVILNIYPYAKGHVLIIAQEHGTTIDTLPTEQQIELIALISATTKILKTAFKCPGINIGYNEGKCSGASVPDHLHVHLLPRYEQYDKCFIQAIADTQVVQWNFKEIQQQLLPYFEGLTNPSIQL